MDGSLLEALLEVALVNVILSGDNAVVIGLAARDLPPRQARRAVLLGGIAAVALRLALTLPAEALLRLPLLRAGGGVLLAWIAYRLLAGGGGHDESTAAGSLATAVRLIVVADATMSLDNVLAVAAVAEHSARPTLILIVGLALSIPLVLLGGAAVARLLGRLPLLAWLGAAVLTVTAADLVLRDAVLDGRVSGAGWVRWPFAAAVTAAVLGAAAVAARRSPGGQAPPASHAARR